MNIWSWLWRLLYSWIAFLPGKIPREIDLLLSSIAKTPHAVTPIEQLMLFQILRFRWSYISDVDGWKFKQGSVNRGTFDLGCEDYYIPVLSSRPQLFRLQALPFSLVKYLERLIFYYPALQRHPIQWHSSCCLKRILRFRWMDSNMDANAHDLSKIQIIFG